jgi:IS5 family transposase
VVADSTVQEKNVTYPVDTKQYRKIIRRCWKLVDNSGVGLRRRYRKEVRACIMAQRLRKDPRRRKAARRGHRRLPTIGGTLIRELERKLPAAIREEQRENFALYRRVLAQKPQDTAKIYSLHEPHIYCVAKGKEHKKYEFGTKASIAMTKTHGIIVAASPMRRTSTMLTLCPKSLTRPRPSPTPELLAPSSTGVTAVENGLMLPRS